MYGEPGPLRISARYRFQQPTYILAAAHATAGPRQYLFSADNIALCRGSTNLIKYVNHGVVSGSRSVITTVRDDKEEPVDRRSRIVEGAGKAFLRYGFERASMADISFGAGVSRTALYHYFPGKEEVLRAVVDELHTRSLSAATEALENSQTLDAALSGLLEAKFGRVLALLTESPHGVELVDATHRVTGPANREADAAFKALVVSALKRHGRVEDINEVAETLIDSAKGLMRSGDVHVAPVKFHERIQRLVNWITE
jgi:AcrR family transcriptional regulator